MQIDIPYTSEDKLILGDVVARISVLFPNLEVTDSIGALTISGVEQSHLENVKQTALDQLIRSRFDAQSAALREALYEKLLG